MKATQLTSLAALALAAAMTLPASANIPSNSIVQDVYSAVGSAGQVNVAVRDGVVTLTGYASDNLAANRAAAAAASHPDVEKVINQIWAN